MDYWSCALEGRVSPFSDELDYPVDAYARNRKPLAGWEPSFSELPREPLCSDHTGVFMLHSGEAVADSARNVEAYTSVVRSTSSVESVSNHSSSVIESNSRDTPSSDLNLGGFADSTDGSNDKQSGRGPMFSASPIPQAKRARTLNMRSQTPLCQVYGCNKNLSSSKAYHKRHRVCDVHSKTPRVIVNGMEQRFCQQCSRFHLLIEFDEGKRSCRRRLAGHNERRRKPHFISLAGKTHGLLQSYRGGFVAPGIYEQVNWSTNVKLEEESVMIPIASSSTLHLHGSRSTCASRISSSPTENFTSSTAASATTDSTRVIQSPCALSLLSANSHYLGHMARDTMVRSLSSHPNFNSHASEKCVPSGSSWSKPNLNQLKQMSSLMVYSADHPLKPDEAFDGSNLFNTTLSHSPEEGSTVDLLQLSSHLQRVEQQRTYLQVKNENDDFFSFRTLH